MQQVTSNAETWSRYWETAKDDKGCLPDGGPELGATIETIWAGFAKALPERADVVDLCCGNGSAGRAMLRANRRLSLTGIDAARLPDRGKPPFPVIAEASIAAMPFEDGQFDGAISQYGVEYAGPETALEIARIVKPGGTVRFLMHHSGGAVVAAGRKRSAMLSALSGEELWRAAERRESKRLQLIFDPIVAFWGQQDVILQIANAIRETLPWDPNRRKKRLDELKLLLRTDQALVDGLAAVALDDQGIGTWRKALAAAFELDEPRTAEHQGSAIGWVLGGTRR